mgnify:FL=1
MLRAIFQDLNILHPEFCNSNLNEFVRGYTKIQYMNYHTDSFFDYKNAESLTLPNIPQKYCLYIDFQDLFVKLFLFFTFRLAFFNAFFASSASIVFPKAQPIIFCEYKSSTDARYVQPSFSV